MADNEVAKITPDPQVERRWRPVQQVRCYQWPGRY